MKLVLLIASLLFLSLNSNAQDAELIPAKKFLVGGAGSYSSYSVTETAEIHHIQNGQLTPGTAQTDVKRNRGIFSIHVGYFINPHLLLGIQLGAENQDYDYINRDNPDGDYASTINGWDLGLFARYSFRPEKKLDFYLEPSVAIGRGNIVREISFSSETTQEKYQSHLFKLASGLQYKVAPSWLIRLQIGQVAYLNQQSETIPTGNKASTKADRSENTSLFSTDFFLSFPRFGVDFLF